jgi:hypothetical protein
MHSPFQVEWLPLLLIIRFLLLTSHIFLNDAFERNFEC